MNWPLTVLACTFGLFVCAGLLAWLLPRPGTVPVWACGCLKMPRRIDDAKGK